MQSLRYAILLINQHIILISFDSANAIVLNAFIRHMFVHVMPKMVMSFKHYTVVSEGIAGKHVNYTGFGFRNYKGCLAWTPTLYQGYYYHNITQDRTTCQN